MKTLGRLCLCILLTSISGCGRAGDERASPPRVGDTVPLTRTSDGAGVPWLETVALDGDTVTIADLRGSPVMLNLWATWCPPCRAEMPYFETIHQEFGPRGLRVVGVTVDGRSALDQVHDFIETTSITYEILHDPSMVSMDLFGVVGLPGTFLLDAEGVVRFVQVGPIVEGDPRFEGAIEALVSDGP